MTWKDLMTVQQPILRHSLTLLMTPVSSSSPTPPRSLQHHSSEYNLTPSLHCTSWKAPDSHCSPRQVPGRLCAAPMSARHCAPRSTVQSVRARPCSTGRPTVLRPGLYLPLLLLLTQRCQPGPGILLLPPACHADPPALTRTRPGSSASGPS